MGSKPLLKESQNSDFSIHFSPKWQMFVIECMYIHCTDLRRNCGSTMKKMSYFRFSYTFCSRQQIMVVLRVSKIFSERIFQGEPYLN